MWQRGLVTNGNDSLLFVHTIEGDALLTSRSRYVGNRRLSQTRPEVGSSLSVHLGCSQPNKRMVEYYDVVDHNDDLQISLENSNALVKTIVKYSGEAVDGMRVYKHAFLGSIYDKDCLIKDPTILFDYVIVCRKISLHFPSSNARSEFVIRDVLRRVYRDDIRQDNFIRGLCCRKLGGRFVVWTSKGSAVLATDRVKPQSGSPAKLGMWIWCHVTRHDEPIVLINEFYRHSVTHYEETPPIEGLTLKITSVFLKVDCQVVYDPASQTFYNSTFPCVLDNNKLIKNLKDVSFSVSLRNDPIDDSSNDSMKIVWIIDEVYNSTEKSMEEDGKKCQSAIDHKKEPSDWYVDISHLNVNGGIADDDSPTGYRVVNHDSIPPAPKKLKSKPISKSSPGVTKDSEDPRWEDLGRLMFKNSNIRSAIQKMDTRLFDDIVDHILRIQ